jgi:nucleoside 2-deoxyribosyltransferase
MSRPRVYLAGPITGLSYGGATDWREAAKYALHLMHIDGFSPLRAKQYLKGEEKIDGSPEAYQRVHPLSAPKGICTRDREDVRRADVVLMNLLGAERISVGSMIEIGWADAFRVPLVVIMEGGVEYQALPVKNAATDVVALGKTNPHHHAMVNQLAGYIVGDLQSGLDVVKALVLP